MHSDIGNLRPDHQTVLVAEVVELLRVLVVRQPKRCSTDLFDDFHIKPVLFW